MNPGIQAHTDRSAITSPNTVFSSAAVQQLEFPFESLSLPPRQGFQDSFAELRFHNQGQLSVADLISNQEISFLSKTTQKDLYYRVDQPLNGMPAGVYRVRHEGEQSPLLTLKIHGDGKTVLSETIDILDPSPDLLDGVINRGTLVTVIEKDRTTYKSRKEPNCLLHLDEVRGIGDFIDTKADSTDVLNRFLSTIGLEPSTHIAKSYIQMKEEKGVDPLQLKVWSFHQRFQDYIMGVVSGTLTPLGFLSAALASNQPRSALIVALLSAGFCDGISDSVASSQATQSVSRATAKEQIAAFATTMTGKIIIPMTFVPITIISNSNSTILTLSSLWAATLLTATAAVQSIANERSVVKAVSSILAWGAAATMTGTALGYYVPRLFEALFK